MSHNVLVVPENPTYNGAILKPLCDRLFAECGRTQANIEVMLNPRTNGYEHAKSLFPTKILDLYSHKHLVLFLPDSDVEAWLLAGHRDKWESDWNWETMRTDRSIKENYFHPFLRSHGQDFSSYPDEGRKQLMQVALQNYSGIKQRCPELQELETRVRAHLNIHL